MKKIYKVIAILIFALILLIPASAFAQLSLGSIQNAVEQPETKNCVYISKSIHTPVHLQVQYATTSDVIPAIVGENPNSQFSSDFNNEGFFFSTETSDHWNIRLDIGYEASGDEPRNYFYEIQSGNNTNLVDSGNWKTENDRFCAVLVLQTIEEPHIKTTDEIIEDIAKWEIEQHDITHTAIQATNDLIAIIVVAVVAVGFVFAVIMVFMKINKSKESTNASFVSKQFAKQVEKFGKTTKYLMKSDEYRDIKIDYIIKGIKDALTDVMWGMKLHNKTVKESAFTVHAPVMTPDSEKVTKGISLLDKAKDVLKDQLEIGTKSTEKSSGSKWNDKTDDEIYDKLQEMAKDLATKYANDPSFKAEYDEVMKIYKERNNKT